MQRQGAWRHDGRTYTAFRFIEYITTAMAGGKAGHPKLRLLTPLPDYLLRARRETES